MEFPGNVQASRLFMKLAEDASLLEIVSGIRTTVERLAAETVRTVPNFTDHTVRHMDALWVVADAVLASEEVASMSKAEAFLLSSSFYLHDIGMAFAATEKGAELLRSSQEYKSTMLSLKGMDEGSADAVALANAARMLHAEAALTLALHPIPGTDRFIIESKSVRDAWGNTLGNIAASHHWNCTKLEATFGDSNVFPLPDGNSADLLLTACYLRLIDYAHINRDRARSLDRAVKMPLADGSLIHWLAQEHIDGPARTGDELIYRSAKPVSDVNSWWLFYELLSGLNKEIKSVRKLLRNRRHKNKELSLVGVRGVDTPDETAKLIPPDGFLPVEVGVSASRADKIVKLLAGETLYGAHPVAAVRELLQNARDAVGLKRAVAENQAEITLAKLPIRISIRSSVGASELVIQDWGIGMSEKVMTDYLLSIGASYWDTMYISEFPNLVGHGFKHAGRFGIGFLSVFMLGSEIEVESNRAGQDRFRLKIRGTSQRGELRKIENSGHSGTLIKIALNESVVEKLGSLKAIVEAYAPTLPHSIEVEELGQRHLFDEGWIYKLSDEEFHDWAYRTLRGGSRLGMHRHVDRLKFIEEYWIVDDDDMKWVSGMPTFVSGQTRLIASSLGVSLLCSHGLVVERIPTPGFAGLIEIEDLELTSSRNSALNPDVEGVLSKAREGVRSSVQRNLEYLARTNVVIGKTKFFEKCIRYYGKEIFIGSDVPWVGELRRPGTFVMLSTAELLSRLTQANSVFLYYNSGPVTAIKEWAKEGVPDNEIAILFEDSPCHFYRNRDDHISGCTLDKIIPDGRRDELLNMFIELLADAWGASVEAICQSSSFTAIESKAWGRISKRQLVS